MDEGYGYELALSAAISRFLNLITHAGMNMCNLSKYYDVAKFFKIPRHVVDVRHDSNHGREPSKSQLKSVLSFCFKWIMMNYWEFEDSVQLNNQNYQNYANYQFIHDLFDCYKYLQIYVLWGQGQKTLRDPYFKDQKDIEFITNFMQGLLSPNGPPSNKKKKVEHSIIDCRQTVRNYIHCNHISQKNFKECHLILHCLCKDQLLIPDEDTLEILKEGTDHDIDLPDNLVKVWSDVLSMIYKVDLLPKLCSLLIETVSTDTKLIISLWIKVILNSLVSSSTSGGESKKKLKIKPDENEGDGRWNTVIEEAVLKCDTSQFLSCLESIAVLRNPPLNTDQCNRIKKLSILKNSNLNSNEEIKTEWVTKTVSDIYASSKRTKSHTDNDSTKWKFCDQYDWSTVPLGSCPENSIFTIFPECENEKVNDINVDDDFLDEVKPVDWHHLLKSTE